MSTSRLDLVLGGAWHDFPGFARVATDTLCELALQVHESFSLETLKDLERLESRALLLFTCPSEPASSASGAAEFAALTKWVTAGGALLVLHSTAVAAQAHAELEVLIGGSFVSHPPKSRFLVVPMLGPHPITDGIEAFEVEDELYTVDYDSNVTLLLVTLAEGRAHPLAWTRDHGSGRVVYIALGHDAVTWNAPNFRRLLVQSVKFLIRC